MFSTVVKINDHAKKKVVTFRVLTKVKPGVSSFGGLFYLVTDGERSGMIIRTEDLIYCTTRRLEDDGTECELMEIDSEPDN